MLEPSTLTMLNTGTPRSFARRSAARLSAVSPDWDTMITSEFSIRRGFRYRNSDARSVSTGIPEYELTLRVSQKLKTELESRGYTVILTRETNDVPVSCVQRAETANGISADAFVRIHANGADSSSAQGAMTICITPENPFYPELYTQSRALSDAVINELCAAAGCENDGVWETDSMSGNNWSKVPATIVEMGYMTNPAEDELMARDDYQNKLTQGIANGIEAYFQGQ